MENLVMKQVSFSYQDGETMRVILNEVSYQFPVRGLVVISGPSGVGKSTLLYLLGGLLAASQGEIFFGHQNIAKMTVHPERFYGFSVGFLFQSRHLLESYSVNENLLLPLLISGISFSVARKKISQILHQFNLENLRNQQAGLLSGGEMARIALIRSLISEPEILLADEPTGQLDEKSGAAIIAQLETYAQDHLVIVVSHHPEWFKMAQQYLALQDGKLIYLKGKIPFGEKKRASITRLRRMKDWTLWFAWLYAKRHFMQHLFANIVLGLGFLTTILGIYAYRGMGTAADQIVTQYSDWQSVRVSLVESSYIGNGGLSISHSLRPSLAQMAQIRYIIPHLSLKPDLGWFANQITLSRGLEEIATKINVIYTGDVISYVANDKVAIGINQLSSLAVGDYLVLHLSLHEEEFTTELTLPGQISYCYQETTFLNQAQFFIHSNDLMNILEQVGLNAGGKIDEAFLRSLSSSDYRTNFGWQVCYGNQGSLKKLEKIVKTSEYSLESRSLAAQKIIRSYQEILAFALGAFLLLIIFSTISLFLLSGYYHGESRRHDFVVLRFLGGSRSKIAEHHWLTMIMESSLSLWFLGVIKISAQFINIKLQALTGISTIINLPSGTLSYGLFGALAFICLIWLNTINCFFSLRNILHKSLIKELHEE